MNRPLKRQTVRQITRQMKQKSGVAVKGLGTAFIDSAKLKMICKNHLVGGGGSDHQDDDSDSDVGMGTATISKPKSETKTPPLYRVMLMNDDFTPMDFVIHVLQKFFQKDMTEATQIMLQVHHQGSGLCGVFSYEIAETKVYQVNQYSRKNRHPLKCTMEKV